MFDVRVFIFPRPIGWGEGQGEGQLGLNSHRSGIPDQIFLSAAGQIVEPFYDQLREPDETIRIVHGG
jgi:hypothetical protein